VEDGGQLRACFRLQLVNSPQNVVVISVGDILGGRELAGQPKGCNLGKAPLHRVENARKLEHFGRPRE
jgi:hypothetical protein